MEIYQEKCPQCKEVNYYDNGDESDLAKQDIEALQCWNCGLRWLLPEAKEWMRLLESCWAYGHKETKS